MFKNKNKKIHFAVTAIVIAFALLFFSSPAQAYIGPGAGFAFLSSFFVIFASIGIAILVLITTPVRFLIRAIKGLNRKKGRYDRVIVIGLDGMDPGLTMKLMDEGLLPNFKTLMEQGSFSPLKTTWPAMSPVAWSSFSTGVSPARHNIFDFLTPDRKTYFPVLSSSAVLPPAKKFRIGNYSIPIGKPSLRYMRKGRSFWAVLSEKGIFSTIIRVPITFPPERFAGQILSAMCTPDLRGTQGSFSFYSSEPARRKSLEGGERVKVYVEDRKVKTEITGPSNPFRNDGELLKLPIEITWTKDSDTVAIKIGSKHTTVRIGYYTPWIHLPFKAAPGVTISGICRIYLVSLEPDFKLYISPINIDPNKPALPVSHPLFYSIYLSKMIGSFSTLGLAEDTWALNERVIDEKAFLEQCWLNHEEREKMLFLALSKVKRGVVTCVFDATDRIQHTFWRYHEKCSHQPLDNEKDYKHAIKDLYIRMDFLLESIMKQTGDKDALIVMSDHGFKSFRRGVDLNVWLEKNGYLVRKKSGRGEAWLKSVDWTKTKAYALGLAGIYINIKGREGQGIVPPEDAAALRRKISSELSGLKDQDSDETAILRALDPRSIMAGPYIDNAPDVMVGYNDGYRASWDCAVGRIGSKIFTNNTKSWSGDHCIDPDLVPGIFFNNIGPVSKTPNMLDIAPTILSLLDLTPPPFMEGKPLFGQPDEVNKNSADETED